jgi:nucleoside-diphosphate-sugar epimerase
VKVLITGASGFLGSWFLNHFLTDRIERGDDVWYMDIRPHPAGIPIDLVDMEAWLADFDEDVDIAFHFAAPVGGRMKIEHDPMYNADAFRLDSVFFRWAVRHAALAVYPSSSAIYPTSLQSVHNPYLLNEGYVSPKNPNWSAPDELYGFSKLTGEYMAWKAAEKHDLPTLCIRPFSGYGPGQSLDYPIPSILARAKRHEKPLLIWGSGDQTRDFVFVTDIVGATMARIEAGIDGYQTMNISSGLGVTFRQIAQNAAAIAKYEPEIVADGGKPEGVLNRRGDNQRMLRYYKLKVDLINGLRTTYESLSPEGELVVA